MWAICGKFLSAISHIKSNQLYNVDVLHENRCLMKRKFAIVGDWKSQAKSAAIYHVHEWDSEMPFMYHYKTSHTHLF